MKLRVYQLGELLGVIFLLISTATQVFYVEPLKREIEMRLAAFNMQQNGQVQIRAIYGNRIAMLRTLKAPDDDVKAAEVERDAAVARYKNADADIADYLFEKERVEEYLQYVVLGLFAFGSLLAGFGRAMEMIASGRAP